MTAIRATLSIALVGLLVGCEPASSQQRLDPAEPCGPMVQANLTLEGELLDENWQPVVGVDVALEERALGLDGSWAATTDENGVYTLKLEDYPLADGCWDAGPQFYVVADDGAATCEVNATTPLALAWLDETHTADLHAYPCVLQ